jgi:hypothetical protein
MKNRPNHRRKSRQGDRSRVERARRHRQEEALDDALKNTFPASDPVSIVQSGQRTANFDSVKTSTTRATDEREAFWAAVYKFRSPKWSSAFSNQPTFEVKGKYLTIRQVCELVKDISDELPYLVAGELVKAMRGDRTLIQLFAPRRTYAIGSRCLLALLKGRVAAAR